ncbi:hypothetical protein BGX33_005840, partial [Mortierella sp. NVP41]
PKHIHSHVSLQVQQEQDRLCCHHPSPNPSYLPQRAALHPGWHQDDPRPGPRDRPEQSCDHPPQVQQYHV